MNYITLLTPFVRDLPRFSALAAAVLRQAEDLIALIPSLTAGFSLEAAEGIQLDLLAASLGLSRSSARDPSDTTFRAYIRAKLALWRWDGSNESVPALLAEAFPGVDITLTDNTDLTVTASGGLSALPGDAKTLLPVPAGVAVRS